MTIETSIKNNKTIIPDSILDKIGAEDGDLIKWTINKEGKIELDFDDGELAIEELVEESKMTFEEFADELRMTFEELAEVLRMTVEDLTKESDEISQDMDDESYIEIDAKEIPTELDRDYSRMIIKVNVL